MEIYEIPDDKLVEEVERAVRRMPGQHLIGRKIEFDPGTERRLPVPEGAPRCLDDIPEKFRRPEKPPTARKSSPGGGS